VAEWSKAPALHNHNQHLKLRKWNWSSKEGVGSNPAPDDFFFFANNETGRIGRFERFHVHECLVEFARFSGLSQPPVFVFPPEGEQQTFLLRFGRIFFISEKSSTEPVVWFIENNNFF
jgi:hypothetical protein